MKNADNAKQPAMPYCVQHGFADYKKGLTKREIFAMAAMQGLLASDVCGNMAEHRCAELAVSQADAILAELEKK